MRLKLICLIVLAMFIKIASAQTFGIKGGMNIASMNFSSSGFDVSPKSIIGVHIGPVVEFKLQESLYFNSGLLYSLKGFKMESEGESASTNLNYLEIPLNLAYKFPASETSNFFVQAGPYLAYALSGKAKYGNESENINFKEDGLKRIDLGVGIGLGFELGPLVPSVSYQLGLSNLNDDSSSDMKAKNKVFQISVAYMFGEK